MVAYGEDIPYAAAFLATEMVVTDEMRAHASGLASRLGRSS